MSSKPLRKRRAPSAGARLGGPMTMPSRLDLTRGSLLHPQPPSPCPLTCGPRSSAEDAREGLFPGPPRPFPREALEPSRADGGEPEGGARQVRSARDADCRGRAGLASRRRPDKAHTMPNKARNAAGRTLAALRAGAAGGRADSSWEREGVTGAPSEVASGGRDARALRRGDSAGLRLPGTSARRASDTGAALLARAGAARARGRCRPTGGASQGWEPRGTPVFLTEGWRRDARADPAGVGRSVPRGVHQALLGTRPTSPLAVNEALAKVGK